MVSAYSLGHFLVDFSCAFLMFRFIAGTQEGYVGVLLYNFCAFAMQMPLGVVADKLNKNYLFAIIGLVLVATAYVFVQIPLAAVIVIGTGNALFHIGGGIDVLNISEKKLSALGVFVSPGAFGIYFGTILGRGVSMQAFYFPVMMLAAVILIYVIYRSQKGSYPGNAAFSLWNIGFGVMNTGGTGTGGSKAGITNAGGKSTGNAKAGNINAGGSNAENPNAGAMSSGNINSWNINSGRILIAAACFFLVVCLRSFVGLALDFPWKGFGSWGVTLVCAVVFGKVAGGFVADKLGVVKTSILSLGAAALLFLLFQIPVAGVAALLLFNMTMPVTLWAMAKLFPGAKGFAFGLLTFALFLGFLPVYLKVDISAYAPWLFAALSVVSLGILFFGLRKGGEKA